MPWHRFLLTVAVALALSSACKAQRGLNVPSLEWMVASSDVIVVATVAELARERHGSWDWNTVTLDVRETIKGRASRQITFAQSAGSFPTYQMWQSSGDAQLWFLTDNDQFAGLANGAAAEIDRRYPLGPAHWGPTVVRLGPPVDDGRPRGRMPPPVFTMSLDVLDDSAEIIEAVRGIARGGHDAEVASHSIWLPREVMNQVRLPGDVNSITVPADHRLEPVARRLIDDPESVLPPMKEEAGEDEQRRASRANWRNAMKDLMQFEGVKALRYFNSPDNAERLKPFLDHPAISNRASEGMGEPAHRLYHVRNEAFEILTGWGVDVVQPVLTEPIIHASAPPSTAAITAVHGTVPWNLIDVDIPIELNGDHSPELLRLLINADKDVETDIDLERFREQGVLVQGFALFAWGNGEPILVFYAADPFDGFLLTLAEIKRRPMLFQPGDQDRTERAWGQWFDPEFPWKGWEARQRTPDGDRDAGWQPFGHIDVPRAR